MTAPASAASGRGGQCPPWCATDHGTPRYPGDRQGFSSHVGDHAHVCLPGGRISIYPLRNRTTGETGQVVLSGLRYSGDPEIARVKMAAADAAALADVLAAISNREDLARLTAAIRAAAAVITGAGEGR